MGAMAEFLGKEDLIDDFFAPVQADLIDTLLAQYRSARKNIDALAEVVNGGLGDAVHYFIEGNAGEERFHRSLYVEKLFQKPMAYKALDAAYWSKALSLTDVYDHMPQKRRDEWNKQLVDWKQFASNPDKNPNPLPEFEEGTVRGTISTLLAMRAQFFSERVGGIFFGLSGEHVTNRSSGFSKRMVLARALSSYYSVEHSTCGLINDLRCVIAKFMGRDEPKWNATSRLIEILKGNWGKWISIDGGALRIRLYMKGTAHIEVHPSMAWRLNQILAHMYPMAIPPEFRTKPKKKIKSFDMMARPLPFSVIAVLANMEKARRYDPDRVENRFVEIRNGRCFKYGETDKAARAEASRVIEMIGGIECRERGSSWFQFDFNPDQVIDEIVASGCIPDQKSHQFYATPDVVADAAIEEAQITDADECIEPSAGNGALADRLPKERTTCIEIAPLRCKILTEKGHSVEQADFLEWSERAWAEGRRVDKIIANPPFSEGRAQAHLLAAARLVKPGGRMVFVLPASMKDTEAGLPAGWLVKWSSVFDNEFAGTSVSVVILTAIAP